MRRAPFRLLLVTIAALGAPIIAERAAGAAVDPCARDAARVAALKRRVDASCRRRLGCSDLLRIQLQHRVTAYADRCVRMNQIQVLGSHNSYHIEPAPDLMAALLDFTDAFEGIQYTHAPLATQFDFYGIRQIEIDVYPDPQGGYFATRHVLIALGQDPASHEPELDQPGLKVLHLPDVDFRTRCLTFVDCLHQVKDWSDAHPRHLPLMVLVEAKTDFLPDLLHVGFVKAIPFDAAALDEIDADIRSVFAPEDLITPDDIRAGLPTLEQGVLTRGWPLLGDARGRMLFTLDNGGDVQATYRAGHPSLAGRVLFTDTDPGHPEAAFVKANDPFDPRIPDLVRRGYVVRTRADADTVESRANDTAPRDSALASGAQWVSTDYEVPDLRFSPYQVSLPEGTPARCNPVNAAPGCLSAYLAE